MIKNRIKKYLLLIIGSFVISFLVTIILIIITGDRISGLKYFAIPTILLINLSFAITQIELTILRKVIYGIIASIISICLILIPIYFDIKLNIDMYGFWDLIVFFSIGIIVTWECIYQIDKRINKNYTQQRV